MPLIHSKSPLAFKSNLKAEERAGKPKSQALAIAYNIKKKKMANGGEVENEKENPMHEPKSHMHVVQGIMDKMKMAKGGEVESLEEAPEYHDPDLLSDEEDDHMPNLTYPDPDGKEGTEGQGDRAMEGEDDPKMKMKKMLRNIMMEKYSKG